jgi:hypothetical protein
MIFFGHVSPGGVLELDHPERYSDLLKVVSPTVACRSTSTGRKRPARSSSQHICGLPFTRRLRSIRATPSLRFTRAIKLLQRDPDAHVRAMAIEVVGQFIHTNALAAAAISATQQGDENPTVRKKAGWYVPGGPIHSRTKPRLCAISSS